MAYISGLTQGLGSFVITLIMVRFVTALYSHVPRSTQLVLPALLTVAATGTCLASIHALVGTRDIVRTIAPALSVAFVFNVFTAAKLRRLDTPFAQAVRHGRTDP
jgi:ABC-type antimicrobial peptide transport system permease subunit